MPAPEPKLEPTRDPIPGFAHEVLALYAHALSDVHFPDLDLGRLSSCRDAVCAAQLAVEHHEAELQAARAQLQEQLDRLTACSERALAYARVFAGDNTQLQERIAQIGSRPITAPSAAREPQKRKRRGKSTVDTQLFGAAEGLQPMAATESAA
jgi:hypothetical protein